MLTALSPSWLPLVVLLAPAAHARGEPVTLTSVTLASPAATDTSTAASPLLLTAERVTTYAAVNHALVAYWAAHKDRFNAAQAAHPRTQTTRLDDGTITSVTKIDIPAEAAEDSNVAALFTKSHFNPADFAPTQDAVEQAIRAVLAKTSVDSTTTAGKNMAVVQAHRKELAQDWYNEEVYKKTLDAYQGKQS